LGVRITFDGAGDGLGQEVGSTGGEVVAQLEVTSAQASHNSVRDGLGRSPVFFMLRSNCGHGRGLAVLGGAGLVHLVHLGGAGTGLLSGVRALGSITAPGPASDEHAS
jgi:hypothetical protein